MSNQLIWFKSSHSDDHGGGNCVEIAYSWRKSSYSDNETGNCVEVAHPWFKSSYSNQDQGGNCIEIASHAHTIHVRDSKLTHSPQLSIPIHSWADFITYASADA